MATWLVWWIFLTYLPHSNCIRKLKIVHLPSRSCSCWQQAVAHGKSKQLWMEERQSGRWLQCGSKHKPMWTLDWLRRKSCYLCTMCSHCSHIPYKEKCSKEHVMTNHLLHLETAQKLLISSIPRRWNLPNWFHTCYWADNNWTGTGTSHYLALQVFMCKGRDLSFTKYFN